MIISFSSPTRSINRSVNNQQFNHSSLTFAGPLKQDPYKGIPADQVIILKAIKQQALMLNANSSTYTLRASDGKQGSSEEYRPTVNQVFDRGRVLDPKAIIRVARNLYQSGTNVAVLRLLRDALMGIKQVPREVSKPLDLDLERQFPPEELPKHLQRTSTAERRSKAEQLKWKRQKEAEAPHLHVESVSQSNAMSGLKSAYEHMGQSPDDTEAAKAFKAAQKEFRKEFGFSKSPPKGEKQVALIDDLEIPIY